MKRDKILLGLIYYYCIEDFFLKFLPVSDTVFLALRLVPEVIIFLIFLKETFNFLDKIRNLKKLSRVLIWLLFGLVFWVLFKVVGSPSIVMSLPNAKAFIRFIPVVFLIILSKEMNPSDVLRVVFFTGLIQIGFGLFELVQFPSPDFFAPRETKDLILNVGKRFQTLDVFRGGLLGTVVHGPTFAAHLNIVAIILLYSSVYKGPTWGKWVLIIICGILINRSFSTLSFVIFLLILLSSFPKQRISSKKMAIAMITLPFLAIPVFLFDFQELPTFQELTYRFSVEYFTREASNNRIWVVLVLLPLSLRTSPLTGFGPNEEFVKTVLFNHSPELKIILYSAFEDVYWATIIMYYGLIGLALFGGFFFLVARSAHRFSKLNNDGIDQRAFKVIFYIILLFGLYSIFIVAPEIRFMSYIFWACSGLVIKTLIQQESGALNYPQFRLT